MDQSQRKFYTGLAESINKRHYPPVDGNISYLFVYAYQILQEWKNKGLFPVHDRLLDLAEGYFKEEKFADYCRLWAYDCLIGLEKYEEYLQLTEPSQVVGASTQSSNTRCNVFYHLDREPTGVDLLRLIGCRINPFTQEHQLEFRDILENEFTSASNLHGRWLGRILEHQQPKKVYTHTLFQGAPISNPKIPFDWYCFYASYDFNEQIQFTVREAENRLREAFQLPRIGEGWISETELFYHTKTAFPETQVVQHGRPSWLGLQHLDIWLPRWKIAIEYQGKQHFEPVDIFGGETGLILNIDRDKRKAMLCKKNGVCLIIATENDTKDEIIHRIVGARTSQSFMIHPDVDNSSKD